MNIKKAAALAAAVAALGAVTAASADAAVLQCGDHVTQDTRLDADVGPCTGATTALIIDGPVTLDLHGHRIFGDGSAFSFGIIGGNPSAVGSTVTNGRIEDFATGIETSSQQTLSRLTMTRVGTGILALGASDVTITRNRMSDVGFGIESDFSDHNTITRNRIRDCTVGIAQMASGGGTSFSRNLVTDCTGRGYQIEDAFDDELVDNRALRNGTGFFVRAFSATTLTRNRAENNTGDGIDAAGAVTDGGRNRAKRNGGVQCTGVSCQP